MKRAFVISALAMIALTACKKDDPKPGNYLPSEVDLSALKAGQKSHYVRYSSDCFYDPGVYNMNGDTLVLEVARQGNQLMFREYFTSGSPSASLPVSTYPVFQTEDFISIPNRENSNLFFFYGNDKLFTTPSIDRNLAFDGCYMNYEDGSPFIGDEIGYTPDIDLGNNQKTNMTVVACVPMWQEIDAFLAYDDHRLEISHTIIIGFEGPWVEGWLRVD